MGWSFRKSFRIAPGLRLNLSRRGVGWSVGAKGFRIGRSGGRTRVSSGFGPFRYQKTVGNGGNAPSGGSGCFSLLIIGIGAMTLFSIVSPLLKPKATPARSSSVAPSPAAPRSSTNAAPAEVNPRPSSSESPTAAAPPASTLRPPRALPTGPAAEAARWRAVARFPRLGVAGSPLNKLFLERVRMYQVEKPELFDQTEWPTIIAAECDAEIARGAR